MSTHDELIEKSLRLYLENTNPSTFENVLKAIRSDLENLSELGRLDLGPDENLSGYSLEIRIRLLFLRMNFDIFRGRDGLEDFIIKPSAGMSPRDPLVIEAKSSRKPNISRDNLRQLDDWVFDLSGEEKARKHGLGGGFDSMSYATGGMFSQPKKHPSPHKGVLIFNGPIGLSFENRHPSCVGHNELDFIEKRNFCIIPFRVLLDYFDKFQDGQEIRDILWKKMHGTIGELELV